jgi:hypothetical protein
MYRGCTAYRSVQESEKKENLCAVYENMYDFGATCIPFQRAILFIDNIEAAGRLLFSRLFLFSHTLVEFLSMSATFTISARLLYTTRCYQPVYHCPALDLQTLRLLFNDTFVRLTDTFRIVIPFAAFGLPQPTSSSSCPVYNHNFLQLG